MELLDTEAISDETFDLYNFVVGFMLKLVGWVCNVLQHSATSFMKLLKYRTLL
jgi:hypothetical protein